MGFKFCWFVELLEDLDAARQLKPLSSSRASRPEHHVVDKWFKAHGHQIPRHGPSAVAFLSCIFPERLSHRSYAMQEARLATVMGRILHLGIGRASRLRRWQELHLDFPTCLQQIMSEAEMPLPEAGGEVTLEEIDEALLQIAANSPFSSPEIRSSANDASPHDILLPIVRRLQSKEARWLVHMILKSYSPVQIPECPVMYAFHFLLPDILAVQNTIEAAVSILGEEDIRPLPPNPPKELRPLFRKACARYVVPKLGVMVRRQPFYKARSIRHCCRMATQRSMSVERKYDGEYCQIHIDLSKGKQNCIQIFSISGKDSTEDRVRLHGAIAAGLRLNEPDSGVKRNCIVEGELLVWSQSKKAIQPFHVIRKHVMHGLRFLGTEEDSPRAPDEQLMIVFYDILLLDDKVLSNEPHNERRMLLEGIVRSIEGEAEIGHRKVINFASRSAKSELREFFAHAINERWEGFVLKGCKDPYLSWGERSSVIKLKKDYIAGLGDTVDLCIVGGRRDQTVVDELKVGELSWTAFHLACLENREAVRRFNAKPVFRILDVLSYHNLSRDNILYLNRRGQFVQTSYSEITPHLDVRIDQKGIRPPTALFKKPFVVEVMGAGFEKPSNTSYFTLRFPRALNIKLHMDRSVVETNTFEEVQELAHKSLTAPTDPEDLEEAGWLRRLILADGKGPNVDGNSQSTSPSKSTTSDRVSIEDLDRDEPGWRDTSPIASTKRTEMPMDLRSSDSTSTPGTPGKDSKRTLELSPSGPGRKRRKSRCGALINGVPLETGVKDESNRAVSAKALVPISYARHNLLSLIPPLDPPAVFRSSRKTPARLGGSVRTRNKRQPLSEIANISPPSVPKGKAPTDLSAENMTRIEKACGNTSMRLREKDRSVQAPKRKLCPSLVMSTECFIKLILDSCWADVSNDSAGLEAHSAHTCLTHRRVYLKLMNHAGAGSEDQVAHEIFGVCRDIREAWTAQRNRVERQCTHLTHASEKRNHQKAIMIFTQRIAEHDFLTGPGARHCDVCDILMDPQSRKFFLACHFLTFETQLPGNASVHQGPGVNGIAKNKVQNGHEAARKVETMSASTTFEWEEATSRLPGWP
ncbi:hypothetical protein A1O3_00513 [Capronia epimyces CBS 606.96]|uniref:ATP-dependent DNA ligase family profile domain-containing protein n=1 Tax=Capronia epimyces CBS 606.96 TaxID=1182542 RepID=W9YHF4_9EURO|nr:uncharacterized protein A1O3_00513 [Capronia epimyces CBS 606.96]EXJ91963.1 hypothetical protein A1O3_00513 [Capronia epimyces CBS 606.96]